MPVKFIDGNIFDAQVEALVNPVNCVGVMGKGLAKQFKIRFPDNFHQYSAACSRNEVQLGNMFVTLNNKRPSWIINFPTKFHWKNDSRIEYITAGLDSLMSELELRNIRSVAVPALGCGLGGLSWIQVSAHIKSAFNNSNKQVLVYNPK